MDQQSNRLGSNFDDNSGNFTESDGKELNGNNLKKVNSHEKRCKRENKKSTRQRASNPIDTSNMSQFSPSQWTMNHAQRQHLYPAMSDPSVCSYQIPISFPMESVSFPCYSFYQPPMMPEMGKPSSHFSTKIPAQSRIMNSMYLRQSENYTSLPPVPPPEATEDHQRRFSDPGLGNVDDSDLESTSSGSNYSVPLSSSKLMDQLTVVNNQVQRLSTQLSQTQSELVDLKLDMVSVKNSLASKYEQPGLLSEMIGEIKKAAEIREKAFMSQISSFLSTLNVKSSGLNRSNESINSSEKLDQPTVTSSDLDIDSAKRVLEVEKKCIQLEQALSDAISARIKAENEAETWKSKLVSITKEVPSQENESLEKDINEQLAYNFSVVSLDAVSKDTKVCTSSSKNSDSSLSSESDSRRKSLDFNKHINPDSTEKLDSPPSKILNSKNYSRKLSTGLEILDHLDDHALGPVTDL